MGALAQNFEINKQGNFVKEVLVHLSSPECHTLH